MLLDRKRVKFWQKWIFLGMAILMASFLIFGYSGVLNGCSNSQAGQGTNVAEKQLKDLEAKLAASPNDLATLMNLADTYQLRAGGDVSGSAAQKSDWTKAASYYERWLALQITDKSATALQTRAETLLKLVAVDSDLQDYAKVFKAYDELTKLDPKNADYFSAMGQAALSSGDSKNALLAFTRYLQLAPNGSEADSIRQWIAQQTGQTASPSPSGSTKP